MKISLENTKQPAIVDIDDFEHLHHDRWSLLSNGYIRNSDGKLMHRVIALRMGMDQKKIVRFVDENKFNCRRSNFKFMSRREAVTKADGGGIRRVYNKFQAYITFGKKFKHLGSFNTKEEAQEARRKAVEESLK